MRNEPDLLRAARRWGAAVQGPGGARTGRGDDGDGGRAVAPAGPRRGLRPGRVSPDEARGGGAGGNARAVGAAPRPGGGLPGQRRDAGPAVERPAGLSGGGPYLPRGVQSAAAAGCLRHRRQPALPAGGRPAGDGPPAHGSLPGPDRARAGALPRAQRLYGPGRGGRGGRGLHPAGGGAGTLMHRPVMMVVKSPEEIARMRRAGRLAARALEVVARAVAPGGVTAELDDLAETFIRDHGGVPSFKHYRGYPASICVSIDDEVVHGIPGTRRLREGSIVSVDLGVYLDGVHGDVARPVPAGAGGGGCPPPAPRAAGSPCAAA